MVDLPVSTSPASDPQPTLLAVDLGLRSGLALYRRDGRLLWYRSTNFATLQRLKRAVGGILDSIDNLQAVVLEGGGQLAGPWQRECARRSIPCRTLSAEAWRRRLLWPSQQQTASQAKLQAGELAREVIDCLALKRPTSLRHDAAEAILIGLYALLCSGWQDAEHLTGLAHCLPRLDQSPPEWT